uniref:hypothetical protein n=1 Tax=Aliarcobacter sp. TaxID=2321116 RepID=UPI004047DAEF
MYNKSVENFIKYGISKNSTLKLVDIKLSGNEILMIKTSIIRKSIDEKVIDLLSKIEIF